MKKISLELESQFDDLPRDGSSVKAFDNLRDAIIKKEYTKLTKTAIKPTENITSLFHLQIWLPYDPFYLLQDP